MISCKDVIGTASTTKGSYVKRQPVDMILNISAGSPVF